MTLPTESKSELRTENRFELRETKAEGLLREYEIQAWDPTLTKRIQERIEEERQKAQVPGYRKGGVPLSLFQKFHSDLVKQIAEEQIRETANEALAFLLQKNNLRPVESPRVSVVNHNGKADNPMITILAAFEIYPDVPKVHFHGMKLTKLVVNVSKEDIRKAYRELHDKYNIFVPADATREAARGDSVEIDFEGKIDDQPFNGSSGTNVSVEIGSNSFLPEFEEQLIGVKAGDKKVIKVTFPDDYSDNTVAGKEAIFDVTIHKVSVVDSESRIDSLENKVATKMGFKDDEAFEQEMNKALDSFAKAAGFSDYNNLLESLPRCLLSELEASLLKGEYSELKDIFIKFEDYIEKNFTKSAKYKKNSNRKMAMIDIIMDTLQNTIGSERLVASAFLDNEIHNRLRDEFARNAGFDSIQALEKDSVLELDKIAFKIGKKSFKDLHNSILSDIEGSFALLSRLYLKKKMFDWIDANYRFEVPSSIRKLDFEAMWEEIRRQMRASGRSLAEERIKEEWCKGIAERRVRLGLILAEIARQLEISVSQEEIEYAILMEAQRKPEMRQQVLKFYENPQNQKRLEGPLLEEKIVNYILSLVDVEEIYITPEEFNERYAQELQLEGGGFES